MAGRGKRKAGDGNGFDDWGGYMAAKISKLENQYLDELHSGLESERGKGLFHGVAIFVNGYTSPPAEELKRIMLGHGGIYHHYHNPSTTTHIVASNLCDAKIKKLRGGEKIVRPEWITDSLQAETLLDFKAYLLYAGNLEKGQQKIPLVNPPKSGSPVERQHADGDEANENSIRPGPSSLSNCNSKSSSLGEMKKAGQDDFLSEFYNRSRLHHISTMGTFFKRLVSELRESSDGTLSGLVELGRWKETSGCRGDYQSDEPVFMHIDMDCFFVSVGLRNYPDLRGKPVVVTHAKADSKPQARREGSNRELEFDCYKEHWIKKSKFANGDESTSTVTNVFPRLQDLDETCSMSEIASCSYEARAAGIYNGMFMGGALKLCPTLTAIPYDFEGYKEVSSMLYHTVATYTLDLEAVSCDELYADITTVLRQSRLTPLEFATHLREVIRTKTQCNASVGMGPNMLVARLSTKKAKPNGAFHTRRDAMGEFMMSHKIEDLPGVGRSIAHRLHAMGVQTCADMQQISSGKLQHEFGQKQGQTLFHMCRGEDKRSLKTDHIRKSISADVNYGIRFANEQEMFKFTQELSAEVSKRMEEIHVKGRLVTLKLKIRAKDAPIETAKFMGHGVCDSVSRSTALIVATRDAKTIHKEVLTLLRQLKADCCELRGMGIQLSKLVVDNVRGKQPGQNSLLSFVSRPRVEPNTGSDNTESPDSRNPRASPTPSNESQLIKEDEPVRMGPTHRTSPLELPVASQLDSSVFNQLPDDLKDDIVQEYQRKGVNLVGRAVNALEPVAGTSKAPDDPPRTISLGLPDSAQSLSYKDINAVSDIDASYWSALPDDIKAEIENDIQQRKMETTSPSKNWGAIFKGHRTSPSKGASKSGKRKVAKEVPIVSKFPPVSKSIPRAEKETRSDGPSAEIGEIEASGAVSLSGATTLPEVRQLLTEWFASTDAPEDEDREVVSSYLISLVKNKELHKVEPIILFLQRWSANKSDLWKKTVAEIVSHAQLYVIQYYNAPLKIPSS